MALGRVVVLGAGVVGLCSAYSLRRAGYEVVLLERGVRGGGGCSAGNAGLIVPSHFVPLAAPGMVGMGLRMMFSRKSPFGFAWGAAWELDKWALRFIRSATREHVERVAPLLRDYNLLSLQKYRELRDELGLDAFGLGERGLVAVCGREDTLRHEAEGAAMARDLGLGAEVLDAAGVSEKAGGVEVRCSGGVFFDCDADLTPEMVLRGLWAWVEGSGVEVVDEAEVVSFVRASKGGRVLRAVCGDGREVGGDVFVMAAGVWSSRLGRELGLEVPVVPGRGHSLTVERAPAVPGRPLLLVDARVAVTPMSGGVRFAGTMELGAWKEVPSRPRVRGIVEGVGRHLPAFGAEVFRGLPVWTGLRPCAPDGLPVVGWAPGYENVFLATGHAMMGMSLGPATGHLVSQALQGGKCDVPLHALRLERFA